MALVVATSEALLETLLVAFSAAFNEATHNSTAVNLIVGEALLLVSVDVVSVDVVSVDVVSVDVGSWYWLGFGREVV